MQLKIKKLKIRTKITLLISLAGLISGLFFSAFIVAEMLEHPFKIIDREIWNYVTEISSSIKKNRIKLNKDSYFCVRIYKNGKVVYEVFPFGEKSFEERDRDKYTIYDIKSDLVIKKSSSAAMRVVRKSFSAGKADYVVYVGRKISDVSSEYYEIVSSVLLWLFLSAIILIVTSYYIAGRILAPVKAINDQAKNITESNLNLRLPASECKDEFNDLARTLNGIFDRLEFAFDKQKKLISDASHELKTPLAVIRLAIDDTIAGLSSGSDISYEDLGMVKSNVMRMERLVRNLLELSVLEHHSGIEKEEVDINGIFTELLNDYRMIAEDRNIHIFYKETASVSISGDRDSLFRAFSNLIDNAIKYNIDNGKIYINIFLGKEEIKIEIINDSKDINMIDADKVFDQFYRFEKSRAKELGGSGLGLSIVKRIIELHKGDIKFLPYEEKMCKVTVIFPK